MEEPHSDREHRRETASERARQVYESLPTEKKEIILDKLNRHRSTAWEHSIAKRKGKALSEDHKAKLGASKRGRTPKRGVSLWAIAEDTLDSLPTTESANKRGGKQPDVYRIRLALGFPKGWPGAFYHGEVLTRNHIREFCEDTDLSPEEAAELIGFGYGAFRNRVGKTGNRPLSSQHPKDPKSPHIGKLLREKYEHVVATYCYKPTTHGKTRQFLTSELLKLSVQRGLLVSAFGQLHTALDAEESTREPDAVCEWLCRKLRMEFAHGEAGAEELRTLLFFGKSFRALLERKPQLFREAPGTPAKVFWCRNVADELLAIDYGATAGGIRYAVERGDVFPMDPRGLAQLLRLELETARNERARVAASVPKKRGPKKYAEEKTRWFQVGSEVERLVQAGSGSDEDRIIAARNSVAQKTRYPRDTVVRYHLRYRNWLEEHPQTLNF